MPTRKDFENLEGKRFGMLVVLSIFGVVKGKRNRYGYYWLCLCDCGKKEVVLGRSMKYGFTKSCGCLHAKMSAARGRSQFRTHGLSKSTEYKIYKGMFARCRNKNSRYYDDYGGRGITICRRWMKFENFYADIGSRPSPKYSLDRKNNDGPYCKSNCRWATKTEQARNTRGNHRLTLNGETKCINEWSEITGLAREVIKGRKKLGWSDERALTEPLHLEDSHPHPKKLRGNSNV